MTRKETTEIFSLMLLAWPNAEMFKGGVQKLAPTIELWSACLPDIDFWLAKRAVVKLCRESKFPPTIAEFRAQAESVMGDVQGQIDFAWNIVKIGKLTGATPERICGNFREGSPAWIAAKAVVGSALPMNGGESCYCGFAETFRNAIKHDEKYCAKGTALPAGLNKLTAGSEERKGRKYNDEK